MRRSECQPLLRDCWVRWVCWRGGATDSLREIDEIHGRLIMRMAQQRASACYGDLLQVLWMKRSAQGLKWRIERPAKPLCVIYAPGFSSHNNKLYVTASWQEDTSRLQGACEKSKLAEALLHYRRFSRWACPGRAVCRLISSDWW